MTSFQVLCAILASCLVSMVTGNGHSFAYHSSVLHPGNYVSNQVHHQVLYPVCPIVVCPAPPPPKPEPDPNIEDTIEFTKKITDTVCNVGSSLSEIGAIALEDNPEIGAEIVKKLQTEISKGAGVFSEFAEATSDTAKGGRRKKRAAKEAGTESLNMVGDLLAKSDAKIEAEKKKLSKKAQAKIAKAQKAALDKCLADSCKAASKLLDSAADASDERQ